MSKGTQLPIGPTKSGCDWLLPRWQVGRNALVTTVAC